MRTAIILTFGLYLEQAVGNIPVSYERTVTLTCNHSLIQLPGYTGCLRGMSCIGDEMWALKLRLHQWKYNTDIPQLR